MSDVKHHVNANTSILGRQYTLAVTFDGSFCVWMSLWQNGKLLIVTKNQW